MEMAGELGRVGPEVPTEAVDAENAEVHPRRRGGEVIGMVPETRRNNTNVIRLTGRRKRRRWRLPRLKLRYLFLLCVAGWAAYTAVFVQWPKLRDLNAQKSELEARLRAVQEQNQTLRDRVNRLQQDNYVADLARQEFRMAKPGEILFTTPRDAAP